MTAGQDGTLSRHVMQGVGAGHGHTPKGVSCPVPLSRPFVLVVLDIAPLRRGEPYKLDALQLGWLPDRVPLFLSVIG